MSTPRFPVRLSPRQRHVLDGVWAGETNRQMAARFGVSARTIEVHRAVLMQVLGVHNVAQLFRAALQAGLLPRPKGPR
jgi:two-component system response regulator FixJ